MRRRRWGSGKRVLECVVSRSMLVVYFLRLIWSYMRAPAFVITGNSMCSGIMYAQLNRCVSNKTCKPFFQIRYDKTTQLVNNVVIVIKIAQRV